MHKDGEWLRATDNAVHTDRSRFEMMPNADEQARSGRTVVRRLK
jgi:hypothetical protein